MPTTDQLKELPYLEDALRDAPRTYAPVSSTHRTAMDVAVIPFQKLFKFKGSHVQPGRTWVPLDPHIE
jgi:hypothetical protein